MALLVNDNAVLLVIVMASSCGHISILTLQFGFLIILGLNRVEVLSSDHHYEDTKHEIWSQMSDICPMLNDLYRAHGCLCYLRQFPGSSLHWFKPWWMNDILKVPWFADCFPKGQCFPTRPSGTARQSMFLVLDAGREQRTRLGITTICDFSTSIQESSHIWSVLWTEIHSSSVFQGKRVGLEKTLCLESNSDFNPKAHVFTVHMVHIMIYYVLNSASKSVKISVLC